MSYSYKQQYGLSDSPGLTLWLVRRCHWKWRHTVAILDFNMAAMIFDTKISPRPKVPKVRSDKTHLHVHGQTVVWKQCETVIRTCLIEWVWRLIKRLLIPIYHRPAYCSCFARGVCSCLVLSDTYTVNNYVIFYSTKVLVTFSSTLYCTFTDWFFTIAMRDDLGRKCLIQTISAYILCASKLYFTANK
jgi:hypothetical protein